MTQQKIRTILRPICEYCSGETRHVIKGPKNNKRIEYRPFCGRSCSLKSTIATKKENGTYVNVAGRGEFYDDSLEWCNNNQTFIIEQYDKGESVLGIQRLSPLKEQCRRKHIEDIINKAGMSVRGIEQNGKILQLEKAKTTSLAKYGYANASSSPNIKNKREETFQKRYGVSNPFQHPEVKEKIYQTNIDRYGHPNPGCHAPRNKKLSYPHRVLSAKLNDYGILHENEVVIYNAEIFSKYKAPRVDIMIGDLVVEVFGDYYHANPIKYLPSDLISLFKGKVEAQEIWARDLVRLEKLGQCGYRTMIVWEYEIKYHLSEVIQRIKNELSYQ
jgi:hypothetical protein